jgi:enterochelin esterase family protein
MQGVRLFGSPAGNHDPLQQLAGSDVWWASFRMADNARLSYRLAPDVPLIAGSAMEQRRALLATAQRDPLNPKVFPQPPEGRLHRHLPGRLRAGAAKAPAQPWVARARRGPGGAGAAPPVQSRAGQQPRCLDLPPAGGQAPEALLVLFDGNAYAPGVHAHPHRQPHGRRPDPAHGRPVTQRQPAGAGRELPPNTACALSG